MFLNALNSIDSEG